jgi:hypothetical protein
MQYNTIQYNTVYSMSVFYVILRINGDCWNKLNSLVDEEEMCILCNSGIKFVTNFSVQG